MKFYFLLTKKFKDKVDSQDAASQLFSRNLNTSITTLHWFPEHQQGSCISSQAAPNKRQTSCTQSTCSLRDSLAAQRTRRCEAQAMSFQPTPIKPHLDREARNQTKNAARIFLVHLNTAHPPMKLIISKSEFYSTCAPVM